MAFKNFWIKLIKSINHNYLLLENFLNPGKCNLSFEFSKVSIRIINILVQKSKKFQKSGDFFFNGHLLILKSGTGLIIIESCVFKIQKLKIRLKQNLIGVIEKYSTTLTLIILNNYFKIFFFLNK